MPDPYPISTSELIQIAIGEIGKEIPLLKSVISTGDAVFAAIEKKRVSDVLHSILRRVGALEDALRTPKNAATLIYACDQARHDILCDAKVEHYADVVGYLMTHEVLPDAIMDILDNLRKLSASDLKVLYAFAKSHDSQLFLRVDDIAGISPYDELQANTAPVRQKAERVFPSLMRLQGLGIVYVGANGEDATYANMIKQPPNIGPLTDFLRQYAFLTESGQRLVKALPK